MLVGTSACALSRTHQGPRPVKLIRSRSVGAGLLQLRLNARGYPIYLASGSLSGLFELLEVIGDRHCGGKREGQCRNPLLPLGDLSDFAIDQCRELADVLAFLFACLLYTSDAADE